MVDTSKVGSVTLNICDFWHCDNPVIVVRKLISTRPQKRKIHFAFFKE